LLKHQFGICIVDSDNITSVSTSAASILGGWWMMNYIPWLFMQWTHLRAQEVRPTRHCLLCPK